MGSGWCVLFGSLNIISSSHFQSSSSSTPCSDTVGACQLSGVSLAVIAGFAWSAFGVGVGSATSELLLLLPSLVASLAPCFG